MVNRTYGEMFADSRGAPIRIGGETIHGIHRIPVPTISRLVVGFVRATPRVRQALRLTVDNGIIVINDQPLKDVVLWADSAPRRLEVQVTPASGRCALKVWNAWQDEAGAMQAWIGNCGMVIEQAPSGTRLQCSDGIGSPDFNDLVVDLRLEDNSI